MSSLEPDKKNRLFKFNYTQFIGKLIRLKKRGAVSGSMTYKSIHLAIKSMGLFFPYIDGILIVWIQV